MKPKRKIVVLPTITVTAGGDFPVTNFELDERYKKLTGIGLKEGGTAGASMKVFNVNGNTDTFAEGFQLAFLQTTGAVEPDKRYYPLDHPADGKKLSLTITDPGGGAYPYTLIFHLVLEDE